MITFLEDRLGAWVIRFRWPIILATLVAVLAAAAGGRFLHFTSDYRVYFSSDNPELLAFQAMEATYSKNDNVLLVITPRDGDVFTRRSLKALEWITEQAWQTPYSNRVDSLTNFQYTEGIDDELVVRDLVKDAGSLSEAQIARIRDIALHEPLLVNRLVAADGTVAGVNVTVQLPRVEETKETPEVVAFARDLARRIEARYPFLEVRLTGLVMMNNAFSEEAINDMQGLVLASFVLMLVGLGFFLRGLSGTFGTFLVIAFSVLTAMGLGGYLGFPLSPPSATAPTIILTVAIASSVHVLMTYLHELHGGRDKHTAIRDSLRVNLQPVFLASLTTAIGFLTMNFSDVPPFRHLGSFVALGVMASFVLSVTFLPALMSLFPPVVHAARDADLNVRMAQFGDFVVRHRRGLLYGTGAVTLALVASIPRNQLNDVFVNYFDTDVDFRRATDYASEHLTGIYSIDYSLHAGGAGGIADPDYLRDVQAFAEWMRSQRDLIHLNVLTDTFKRLNMNMHGDDPQWYRLPERRDLAAQYLLLYEMSLPYGLDLNNQINIDKSALRVTATFDTLSSNQVLDLERRSLDWLRHNAPHITEADASGAVLMFAHIGARNIKAMLLGSTFALVLISVILIIALRSIRIGAVSMLPNLVPAAMGFGLWGLLVGEIGLALSVVTSMTIGIVVDDTVHFLSKYLRARRERHLSPAQAVHYAFATVGRAMLATSVVLVIGFLVLSLSDFEVNASMGLLTAIVIAFALAADFLLLPPLLMKIEERTYEKELADRRLADAAADSAPGQGGAAG